MNSNLSFDVEGTTDIQLLELCLNGDRDAYGQLVNRYQSLICSMAYSACGNLTRSEDLAQETFVTAWKMLKTLKDRSKFKSWLCGIARNLNNNSIRQQDRNPVAAAAPLDSIAETVSSIPSPVDHVISAEEESLVWQSLEQIPETYRESLVLFYREDQSIKRVAEALELSPDTVKQRLSRGRKLLQKEVAKVVASTLAESGPTRGFTTAVLCALPALAPETATAGVAATGAKGLALAQASGVGLGAFLLAAFLKLFIAGLGVKWQLDSAPSHRERRFTIRLLLAGLGLFILYGGSLVIVHRLGIDFGAFSPFIPALFMLLFCCVWIPLCVWGGRRIKQMRIVDGTWVEAQPVIGAEPNKLSTAGVIGRFAGGTLAATVWLAVFAARSHDWIGVGIIGAISLLSLSIGLSVCLRRPESYFKALGTTVSVSGFFAIIVMNFRLQLWTAQIEPSSAVTGWVLATTNATIISILIVNLFAWKRDAEARKSIVKAS